MTTESSSTIAAHLPNGRVPLPGILTSGQPDPGQFADLARSGVKAVIDLRPAEEPRGFDEPATASAAGLSYYNIPVTAATLEATQFDQFRSLMAKEENRPVLVHCASANRVGALLVAYLMLDENRSRDEAMAIASEVGLRSDDMAGKALEYVAKRREGSASDNSAN